MFVKYAIAKIDTVFKSYKDFSRFVKTAGLSDKNQAKIITKIASIPAIKADPDNFLYLRNRSISAFETYGFNQNYDGFPSKELQEKHPTFIQCPVDVDHKNEDPERDIIGIVLDSTYIPKQLVVSGMAGGNEQIFPFSEELREKYLTDGFSCRAIGDYVENLLAIDKKKAEAHTPGLVEAILQGEVSDTSMGTGVLQSECSVCGNVAEDENQFCDHISYGKGKFFMHNGRKKLAGEINHGLNFFEDSIILSEKTAKKANKIAEAGGEGADFNAKILQVVAKKDMRKPDGSILDYIKTANLPGYYVNQNSYLEIGEEPSDVKVEREKYEKDLQKFYNRKKDVKIGDDNITYGFLRQAFVNDFDKFKAKFNVKSKADEIRLRIAFNKISTTEDVIGIIQAILKKNSKVEKEFIETKLESLGYKKPEIEDAWSYLEVYKGLKLNKQAYFAEDISVSQIKETYDKSMEDDKKNSTEQIGDVSMIGKEPGSLTQNIYGVLNILGKTQQEKGGEMESEEHQNTYNKLKDDVKDGVLDITEKDFGNMIAKDHLDEFDNYYKYIPQFERELEKKSEKGVSLNSIDLEEAKKVQEFKNNYKDDILDIFVTPEGKFCLNLGDWADRKISSEFETLFKPKYIGNEDEVGRDYNSNKGWMNLDDIILQLENKKAKKLDVVEKSKDKKPENDMVKYTEDQVEDEPWVQKLEGKLKLAFKNYWKDNQIKGQESKNQGIGLEEYDNLLNKTEFDYKTKNGDPKDYKDHKNRKGEFTTDEFGRPIVKKAGLENIDDNSVYYKFNSDGSKVKLWIKCKNKDLSEVELLNQNAKRLVQKYRDKGYKVEEVRDVNEIGNKQGSKSNSFMSYKEYLKYILELGYGENNMPLMPEQEEAVKKSLDYLNSTTDEEPEIINDTLESIDRNYSGFQGSDGLRWYQAYLEHLQPQPGKSFDIKNDKKGIKSYLASDDEHSSMKNVDSVGGSNSTYKIPSKSDEKEMLAEYPLSGAVAKLLTNLKAHINHEGDDLVEERLELKKKYKFENADKLKRIEHTKGNIENLKIALKKLADSDFGDSLPMPDDPNDKRPNYNPEYRYYDRGRNKREENFTLEELLYLEDHSLFWIDIDLKKAIRGLGKDYEVTLAFDKTHKEGVVKTSPQSENYKKVIKEKGKENVLEEDLLAQYVVTPESATGPMYSDENNKPITKSPKITFGDFPLEESEYFTYEEKVDEDNNEAEIENNPIEKHEDVDLSETDLGYDKELIEDYVVDMYGQGDSKAHIYSTIKKRLPQLDANLIQDTVFKTYKMLEEKKNSTESTKEAALKALGDVAFNDLTNGSNVKIYKKDSAGNPTSEVVDTGSVSNVSSQQGKDNKPYTDANVNGKNYSTEDFVVMKQNKLKEKKETLDKLEEIVFTPEVLNKKGSLDKLESLFKDNSLNFNLTPKVALNALDSLFNSPLELKQLKPKIASFDNVEDSGFKLNSSPLKYETDPFSLINENFFDK